MVRQVKWLGLFFLTKREMLVTTLLQQSDLFDSVKLVLPWPHSLVPQAGAPGTGHRRHHASHKHLRVDVGNPRMAEFRYLVFRLSFLLSIVSVQAPIDRLVSWTANNKVLLPNMTVPPNEMTIPKVSRGGQWNFQTLLSVLPKSQTHSSCIQFSGLACHFS